MIGRICGRCGGEGKISGKPILADWETYAVYSQLARSQPCLVCQGIGQLSVNIDAIVASVKDAPAAIDKKELLAGLDAVWSLHQHGLVLRLKPAVRRDELAKTIELARQLYLRVQGDPRFDRHSWKLWQGLRALTEDSHLPETLGIKKGSSAFDNFIGVGLATIFEEHFNQSATSWKGVHDTDNPIKGSFVDFAEAVLIECGIPFSGRRRIHDALRWGKRGRKRRPSKLGKNDRF